MYAAFDEIAQRRRVFKVETIGDCYGKSFLSLFIDQNKLSRQLTRSVLFKPHVIFSRRLVSLFALEATADNFLLSPSFSLRKYSGLPDPRKDHAVVMARFARDVLTRMNDLTKRLEVTLGPDTGDLSLRIGLHSGPVTAGVLRGDKSRFQLFGDTVNTVSFSIVISFVVENYCSGRLHVLNWHFVLSTTMKGCTD